MGAHGIRRFSEDVDVLVAAEDLAAVLAAASRDFREVARQPPAGDPLQVRLRPRGSRGPSAVDIDLLVPADAAEAWALATSVRGRLGGRKLDLVSLEALVVLKLRAHIDDPASEAGLKHRADAIALVRRARPDLARLRRFLVGSPETANALEEVIAAPPPRGRVAARPATRRRSPRRG